MYDHCYRMNMKLPVLNTVPALACSLLLSLGTAAVLAGPVFTWVDPDGVTHFSESPPENTAIKARQIEVEPVPVVGGGGEEDNYYSVVRQLERMQKRRLENERAQTERLQAETAARQAEAADDPAMTQDEPDKQLPAIVYPVPVHPVPVRPYPGYGHDGLPDFDRHRDRGERVHPPTSTPNPKYKPGTRHDHKRRPRPRDRHED